jgi:hypothetical protein
MGIFVGIDILRIYRYPYWYPRQKSRVVWSPGAWQGGGGRAAQVARRSTARRQRLGLAQRGHRRGRRRKKERKKELARRGPGHGVESARICLHECTHRWWGPRQRWWRQECKESRIGGEGWTLLRPGKNTSSLVLRLLTPSSLSLRL